MDFITAYKNLTQSLARNDCISVPKGLKDLEDACLEDQLYLSAEICNLMTSSYTEKSRAAWSVLLKRCSPNLDPDDFHIQIPYMAKQEKWWLIEDALDHGAPLNISHPHIFKSFIACAPLERVQQSLSQQNNNVLPEDAVLSVCNPDPRVFEFFLEIFSVQTIKEALQMHSQGVTLSGVRFPITEHPWVISALEKKSISENLARSRNSMERSAATPRKI